MSDRQLFVFKNLIKYCLICEVSLNYKLILSDISHVLMEFCNISSNFSLLLFRNHISTRLSYGRIFTSYLYLMQCLVYRRHSIHVIAVTENMNFKVLNVAKRPELWFQPLFRPSRSSWVSYLSFLGISFIFVN